MAKLSRRVCKTCDCDQLHANFVCCICGSVSSTAAWTPFSRRLNKLQFRKGAKGVQITRAMERTHLAANRDAKNYTNKGIPDPEVSSNRGTGFRSWH
jgi:hypothetical protein